jgi:hypothetical protein
MIVKGSATDIASRLIKPRLIITVIELHPTNSVVEPEP